MAVAVVRHVFVSASGEVLPRWREAFPKAVGRRFGEAIPAGSGETLVWWRLATDNGVESLGAMRTTVAADIPLVVLSDMPGDEEAEACFAAAARGYANTHSVPALLGQIADVVTQGGLWIGESLMQRLLRGVARIPPPAPIAQSGAWDESLTEREREVAQVVAAGASNKEIARELGITERTVKAHVGAVLDKLGVRDRLQLALLVNGHRRNQGLSPGS